MKTDWNNFAPRIGFSFRTTTKSVLRGGYGLSYYTGRFGFTGGTLSTQFPVLYNIQNGVEGDFVVDGGFDALPPVPDIPLPSNGIITPAPNQAFFTVPRDNPISFVHSYNLTYQRELGWSTVWDVGYVGSLGRRIPYQQQLNAALPGARNGGPSVYGTIWSYCERRPSHQRAEQQLQLAADKCHAALLAGA